jgi:hypothetical protein
VDFRVRCAGPRVDRRDSFDRGCRSILHFSGLLDRFRLRRLGRDWLWLWLGAGVGGDGAFVLYPGGLIYNGVCTDWFDQGDRPIGLLGAEMLDNLPTKVQVRPMKD